jgi:hypothetical protein
MKKNEILENEITRLREEINKLLEYDTCMLSDELLRLSIALDDVLNKLFQDSSE